MSWLERIDALWDAYNAKTEQVERGKKPGAGIYGLPPGPKDDALAGHHPLYQAGIHLFGPLVCIGQVTMHLPAGQ